MCGEKHRVHRRTVQRGFTLVELLIVLTILSVAVALVLPNATQAFARVELRFEARTVANLLAQARGRALYEARPFLILFGPVEQQQRQLLLVRDDGRVINRITLPAGFSLRWQLGGDQWTTDPVPVHFFPNGTSEPFRLDLRGRRTNHVQLEIDPLTARVRVTRLYKGD